MAPIPQDGGFVFGEGDNDMGEAIPSPKNSVNPHFSQTDWRQPINLMRALI